MVLNRRDKEQLVIELYRQGKTIRQIASAAHMSFGDIGKIINKIDGRANDDTGLSNKTKTTQALHLFKSGKKLIDVAIELDISANEIEDIMQEYWVLNQLDELALVYFEVKAFLPSFLKLFHCLKNKKMLSEKHITNVLKYVGDDLPELTDRIQCLRNDVMSLEAKKTNVLNQLIVWNAQSYDLGREIDIKNEQLKRMSEPTST